MGKITFKDFSSTYISGLDATCKIYCARNGELQKNNGSVAYKINFGNYDPFSVAFGDSTRIELSQDLTIASTDTTWAFNGNAEIDGNGATLTINKSQGLTVTGTSKTLTLKNMRLVTSQVDAIKCLTSTCKLVLQDVEWVIKTNFAFSTGSCDIAGLVRINADLGTTSNPVTFLNWEWTSAGTMTVTNSAELIFGYGVNFKYNADPTGAANFNATKRRFLLNQFGSKLTFNGASFESTATGLALDQGIINIYDEVIFKPSTSTAAELELAKNVLMNISGNGNLVLQGPVKYAEYLPLKAGDSIILKHANYGIYAAHVFASSWDMKATSAITNGNRWYVHSGATSRFGNAGQNILSGDFIRLENYVDGSGSGATTVIMIALDTGSNAPVSTPRPPYYYPTNTGTNGAGGGFRATFRIHKLGGVIGDPIYLGDRVYLYQYPADDSANLGYFYLGSSNIAYASNFEIYYYKVSTATQPSNLLTNLTWQISELNSAAYTTAAAKTDPFASLNYSTFTPFWPSASLTQF